jgi:hypothetical protein
VPSERGGSEEAIAATFSTAEQWRLKGDARRELNCLSGALRSSLALAVGQEQEEGVAALVRLAIPAALSRMARLNASLWEALRRDGRPTAAVDTSYDAVHAAWLLGVADVTDRYLEIALDAQVAKHFPQTPFWREYGKALHALRQRAAYLAPTLELRGYERYLHHCLRVIQALTTGGDTVTGALRSAQEAFVKRNADKRLRGWSPFDGDGLQPVRWDLRIASIQTFWSLA